MTKEKKENSFKDLDWNDELDCRKPPYKKGADLIKEFVRNLPEKPGVYRMYDANKNVLYVGKAKKLKARVANYTRPQSQSNRIQRMIHATCHMEFIVTNSEMEALLLEANLIKHLNPRYNVLLRDDKSLPYILIADHYRASGLYKHRGPQKVRGEYFGPFASPGAVMRTISTLQRAFLLRCCNDSTFENRNRPCLLYQIKRCSGPCTGEISNENYAQLVKEAKDFLKGKSKDITDRLRIAMQEASSRMEYEQAALYRDRIASLVQIQSHQGINLKSTDEADVFSLYQRDGMSCIQVFFYRFSQNWGNRTYFPKADPELSPSEIISAFIMQFYDNKPIPRLILISHELTQEALIQQALSAKAKNKVTISQPQRGEKKDLLERALLNTKEALARKLAESNTQKYLFGKFSETFRLTKTPRRIEIYDNSHIMGTNAVGAMVVAGIEGFIKNQYRKFNIQSKEITPGDDYGMMREVITRRFTRLIIEKKQQFLEDQNTDDYFPNWPDVLLIDGGKGQLNAVLSVLTEFGIENEVDVIAIAKGIDRNAGREQFFMPNKESFTLSSRDPVLYFVQRLRDEAHRFAIGVHRAKRKKAMTQNPLDNIANIGPKRKRALLKHFGTAKAITQASVNDLKEVEGISEALAYQILEHLTKS